MKYYFFYGGPFSQWAKSPFEIDGIKYNCCEQYMMAEKARLFNDADALESILKSADPKIQKRIGRKVRGFEQSKWENIQENGKPFCWNVVYEGNYAKFNQNPHLKTALLQTGDKILVEASPYDAIWGIGLGADDPKAKNPDQWKGTNWLGEVLTQLKNDLCSKKNSKI